MLVKIPEEPEYLQWLANETRTLHQPAQTLCGVRYQVDGGKISLSPAQTAEDNLPALRRLKPRTGSKQSSFWLRAPV
jgi:Lon-like ATP-dependent protease